MMSGHDRAVAAVLRRTSRRRRALSAAVALVTGAGAFVGFAIAGGGAQAATSSAIPHANSAWIYDGAAGTGVVAQSILGYNKVAGANNKINQIYSYGTDIETFSGSPRSIDDGTFYDGANKDNGIWDTGAYNAALNQGPQLANGGPSAGAPAVSISPIIDGTPADGSIDAMTSAKASQFADEIADEVCADDNVSGIQFDYEPFNAESAGQQAFYIEINTDFASAAYGCVDTAHPFGRYFSVFAFGSALATDGAEIKTMLGSDGYFIASLYDLGTNGAGIQNGTGTGAADYPALVKTAVNTTAWYADQLGIPYAYGIPAAASDHEFVDCFGSPCTKAAAGDGTDSSGMLDYTKAAVSAIDAVVSNTDSLFVGTDIWDFGVWTGVSRPNNLYTHATGTSFNVQPASAPTAVLQWLATNLPSYQHTGGAGPTNPGGGGGGGTGGGGTNVLTAANNPGFEGGTLSPWTCTSGTADSTTNTFAGTGALALTPTSTLTAYCQQTITGLTPSHGYTFSAELSGGRSPITITLDQGAVDLTGAVSTGSAYSLVSGTVTTDSTGSVTLRIQAWKQQNGTGYADNVSLVAQ
jgi:hypothetical protein